MEHFKTCAVHIVLLEGSPGEHMALLGNMNDLRDQEVDANIPKFPLG